MQTASPFCASRPKNAPKQMWVRSSGGTYFSVVMDQHAECLAGSVLQGSCILDWTATGQVRPSRKQFQPPPHSAALLVNCIIAIAVPAPPQRIPISIHCHISPGFWELHRQPRLPSVPKPPLAIFGVSFLGTAKLHRSWPNFEEAVSFGHTSGKIRSVSRVLGLWVAELRGNSACHTLLFVLTSPCFASASPRSADLGRNTYVRISGFLRQFLENSPRSIF